MDKHIFTGKNVIIQGITGTQGSFHARNMIKYGTNIIAGTSPTKAGTTIENIPVYDSISAIQKDMSVDISIIFVPARYAKKAIIEAINAHISLIICITEHIPVHDMLQISQHIQRSDSILIGPNCPGVLIPGVHSLGIIPAQLATSGDTAVVSRSGTLTYEAVDLLTKAGFGQKYIIGIGGDMIRGASFVDCLEMFEGDPDIKRIVMIGEIGGTEEIKASEYIKNHVTKPVYAYITGHSAPAGVQMGHAGAILNSNLESADTKTAHLKKSGAITANNIVELISLIR
jgi:succinyl-coA ligase [ADP-forming] subunit alpha 1